MDLLAQMKTFVRVVDAGSLSGAARSLGLSLPAVSRQLKDLERELGAQLLVRSTRRLRITDQGSEWYARSARILGDVDQARDAVRARDEVQGRVVVSTGVTLGARFVVPHLAPLLKKHPRLQIDLRLEDRLVDVVGEGVDVAVRAGAPLPDSTLFVAQPLVRFHRIVVAAPAYLRRRGTPRTPEQLARHDCIQLLGMTGGASRWDLRRGDEVRSVEVHGQLRVTAPLAIRALACDGVGLALVPQWLVEHELERKVLRRVLPDWISAELTAWAFYRSELRTSARVAALVTALRGSETQRAAPR